MEYCSRCGRESQNLEELSSEYDAKLCDPCLNTLFYKLDSNRIRFDNKLHNSNYKLTQRFIRQPERDMMITRTVVCIFLLLISLIITLLHFGTS